MANAQGDEAPGIGDTLILWDGRQGVIESVVTLDDGEQMYRVAGIPTLVRGTAVRAVGSQVAPDNPAGPPAEPPPE